MRRKISLYIANQLVDLDDQSFVLFNYAQETLENPTIVKNSFSQSITLKGTKQNNIVFGEAFRLDRVSGSGFNPRVKTSFVIYNEVNEVLESGYVKLDSIKRTGASVEYTVTLYGGLGQLLYALSYDSDGEKMTLADLDYLATSDPSTEFNYTINRLLVANAWSTLAGEQTNDLFETINFAPAYNGLPDDFDANKAVFDGSLMGATGTYVATLSRDYTEREMQDLRSYLQRPVIRFKMILAAIQRFATAAGYTFTISSSWTSSSNPYYEKLWMTLPILTKRSGTITKSDLLGGTDTPANYLISYIKMFGLKIICEHKTVTIMPRDEFFRSNTIDLSSRVDLSETINISPFVIESKWYEMESEDSGEFASTYETLYGRLYGSQRIDTNHEFNADTKKLTESVIFKGGVQSLETSAAYRNGSKASGSTYIDFPAAFFDGGTYVATNSSGDSEEKSLLATGQYTYTWWNSTLNGADLNDLVQLHEADNKAVDGDNVLLFFDDMVTCPSQMHLSDDTSDMTETPYWNVSSSNTRVLLEIPHFTRFIVSGSSITYTLDWGKAQELNMPSLTYATACSIYENRWKAMLVDQFNENTKVVTAKVNLAGLKVGVDLLRDFYWFDGSVWIMNKITNYSLTTYDPVECEFIQVQDTDNYTDGQEI